MIDLIRLIKLKKINGELNNLSDEQILFVSQFDQLRHQRRYNHGLICDFYINKTKKMCFYYDSDFEIICSYSMIDKIRIIYRISETHVIQMIHDLFNSLNLKCKHIFIITYDRFN